MTLAKKIETEAGLLGIWDLEESLEQLFDNFRFSETEKKEFGCISSERRKKEYIAVRLLLENLLNFKPEIVYEKTGKPLIKNSSLNISVSHSADLAVVLVSGKNVGIDVENTERNIDKIASRFLNENEINTISAFQHPQQAKILFWSAKEAIFKCACFEGIQFNRQINIQPFVLEKDGKFSGELKTETGCIKFELWYFFHKNNVVVFCVEE